MRVTLNHDSTHTPGTHTHTLTFTARANLESVIIFKWEEKGKKAHRGSGEHANPFYIYIHNTSDEESVLCVCLMVALEHW